MRRHGRGLVLTVLAAVLLPAASAAAAPGPPDAPEYWFDSWHVQQLWDQGARGNGITIAEIDTGVNTDVPELAGQVLNGTDFGAGGNGHIDREASTFGHGTAMASIMVGKPGILGITGLAPGAKLLPIAVPLTGTTDAQRPDHLADAIRWAAQHGGKVISMSLGGDAFPHPEGDPCPADEQAAIYYALQKGAVVLAASGNDGPSKNTVEEPGVCLGVISVGAVDSTGAVADFSSRHPYLTITAPGVDVASLSRTVGTAYSGKGTSQATAIASAALALVWSKYPKLTGRQVVARVLATLDHHRTVRDPNYGYGMINAYRAVTASVPASAPNPVFAAADPFIARSNALAKAGPAPPAQPAGTDRTDFGKITVRSAPRFWEPQVRHGLEISAGGVIAIVLLVAWAGFARRRRRKMARSAERAEREANPFWREIVSPPRTDPGLAVASAGYGPESASYGPPPYGEPPYGERSYGQPPYGQPPYGQPEAAPYPPTTPTDPPSATE